MIHKLDLPNSFQRIDLNMGQGSAVVIVIQCPEEKRDMLTAAVMSAVQPLQSVPVPVPCAGCGQ